MAKAYIESLAVQRPPRGNIATVLGAGLLLLFAWAAYYAALEPFPNASEGYKVALRGVRFARMGWALFFSMLGLWLIARSARQWFGIPAAQQAGARWFIVARRLLIFVLLYMLTVGLFEPVASPHGYSDDRWIMGIAAGLVWLSFVVDLIPLVRRAVLSLRARVSAVHYRRSTIAGSETGRVRIEGRVLLGTDSLDSTQNLVYSHMEDEQGESIIQVVPFLLESEGQRLFVDVVTDKTVVVPAESFTSPLITIAEGDKVEVWGQVDRHESDAYRGQPARIGPGKGRLFIFEGSHSLNAQLVRAAAVELLACTSYLAVGVAFAFDVFGLYLFTLA